FAADQLGAEREKHRDGRPVSHLDRGGAGEPMDAGRATRTLSDHRAHALDDRRISLHGDLAHLVARIRRDGDQRGPRVGRRRRVIRVIDAIADHAYLRGAFSRLARCSSISSPCSRSHFLSALQLSRSNAPVRLLTNQWSKPRSTYGWTAPCSIS